eukprot:gene9895-biopygen4741
MSEPWRGQGRAPVGVCVWGGGVVNARRGRPRHHHVPVAMMAITIHFAQRGRRKRGRFTAGGGVTMRCYDAVTMGC